MLIPKVKQTYFCIPQTDSIIYDLIQPDLEHGPWIAGGSVLRWFQNLPITGHDIDVFCASTVQYENLLTNITHISQSNRNPTSRLVLNTLFQSDNAVTFKLIVLTPLNEDKDTSFFNFDNTGIEYKIQIIKKYMPRNLDELMSKFDISVCRMATDCKKFHVTPEALRDLKDKKLVFPQGLKPDSLKRLIKYYSYGFKPSPELWSEVFLVPGVITRFDTDPGDYNNAL
jgi:hypothetical protein